MVKSEAWKWDTSIESYWKEPTEEIYYLVSRWRRDHRESILDLGCGIGRHAVFLAENGFSVDAFDLSGSGIAVLQQIATEKKLSIRTQVGDMLKLPYDTCSFDCILAFHTIYHTDREGIEKVIAEIYRVLMDNGEVYLTFNSKSNPSFSDPKSIRIGENTLIKTEGVEIGLPHYFVDEQEISRLMGEKFEILRFAHVEKIWKAGRGCHYFVLAKKASGGGRLLQEFEYYEQ